MVGLNPNQMAQIQANYDAEMKAKKKSLERDLATLVRMGLGHREQASKLRKQLASMR